MFQQSKTANFYSSCIELAGFLLAAGILILAPAFAVIKNVKAAELEDRSNQPYQALLARARTEGGVRVIVGLRMDANTKGGLSDRNFAKRQEKTIASLQETVLVRLKPFHIPASSIKRYRNIPSLAMEIDALALEHLITFPEVQRIYEDRSLRAIQP